MPHIYYKFPKLGDDGGPNRSGGLPEASDAGEDLTGCGSLLLADPHGGSEPTLGEPSSRVERWIEQTTDVAQGHAGASSITVRQGTSVGSGNGKQLARNVTRVAPKNAHTGVVEASLNDDELHHQHLQERFRKGRERRHADEKIASAQGPRTTTGAIRKYMTDLREGQRLGTWSAWPEIPTSDEVMSTQEDYELPRNKTEGPWDSKDEYLEAHYRLLREDVVFPLRAAIHQVRDYPTAQEEFFNGSIGIYDRVYITGLTCDLRGVATRVSFSLSRVGKRIKWAQSKRLISGTLVALTPAKDMFRSMCTMATVAARPISGVEQVPPEVDLFVAQAQEMEIDPSVEWIMVEERSAYFEAIRHVSTALQKLSTEDMPLQEHLISVEAKVDKPSSIKANPVLDLSAVFQSNDGSPMDKVDITNWTQKPQTSLDASQLAALRSMLARKLAIVQGPPGTGKTHVSVVALKIFTSNWCKGDPPIIVSCQTNHALDQLLRHVAPFESQFIRLGGRSKDQDVVKERTLYNVRKSGKIPPAGGMKALSRARMHESEGKIKALIEPLAPDSTQMLGTDIFRQWRVLTDQQCQSLEDGDDQWVRQESTTDPDKPIKAWLGQNLQMVSRNLEADYLALPFEDADLETELLEELEAEANIADEEYTDELKGRTYLIKDQFTGRRLTQPSEAEVIAILKKTSNLYRIPPKQRGSVYVYLLHQLRLKIRDAVRKETGYYNKLALDRKIGGWEQDFAILREQKLIGLTTTGFSKYRPLISALSPRIVLIEEAAEVIEAPVASACVPSLEQLILVGDHQQLRPQCSVKAFQGHPFYLDVSLFERLVQLGVEYDKLRRQRRMIPEIRRLLEPIYGPKVITDHPVVKNLDLRPSVPGMAGVNTFFFTHEWSEATDANMSVFNKFEAAMVASFMEYLILNGVASQDITVLTFYNGQRKEISRALQRRPNLRGRIYNVVTVDSYQGEENEIILLSLTRSNDNFNIGFLKVRNRICVALSRARRGFYLFGNGELLASENNTWADIISIMWGMKGERTPDHARRIGFYLPLQCQKHGRKLLAEEEDDFARINGGCTLPCGENLVCGHPCELKCHAFTHERVECTAPCTRNLDCGHRCIHKCSEPCECLICRKEIKPDPVENLALSLLPRLNLQTDQRAGSGKVSAVSSAHNSNSSRSWNDYARGEAQKPENRHAAGMSGGSGPGFGSLGTSRAAAPNENIPPTAETDDLISFD